MARRPARELLEGLDRDALARFQAGIRKRYSDEEIVEQLLECAQRLGRSPSMREFSADAETSVHPQTVIEHFGSWNAAKRAAGLVPRRFATREELLRLAHRSWGRRSGERRRARDLDEHRRLDAVEVPVLAHVRLADERAARSRLRRPGRRGAARARRRPGQRARAGAGSPAEVPGVGGCSQSRRPRS